jgi:predicted extracellular nuclease
MARARTGRIAASVALIAAIGPWSWSAASPGGVLAASVAWPTATLVVSEVQTGGASASDEFVEIANQGSGPVDLAGLEVVYATASGSTVTRKATWAASTVLDAGRRILVANGAGSIAGLGDVTYTGLVVANG